MDDQLNEEKKNETVSSLAEGEDQESQKPFDEDELLKLAQNEGLVEGVADADADLESNEADVDLSDGQQAELMASMESILFMSDKPVSLPKLRSIINPEVSLAVYRKLMAKLREEFGSDHRGVEIAEVSLGFQLRTKPHMSSVLRKMVKTQPLKLSSTTMEVLAIIAYKQPCTKDEIDQVRGVDSGYVLRNLMEKHLIRISGRSELPGKPMLYGTTHEFLELFNLKDIKALPALHEVEAMVAASEVGIEEQVQSSMQEFSKMIASSDKILFDDSKIDDELEQLRSEIASIPTSTSFLEEQKAQEKRNAKLTELALQGLTLDENDNIIPIGSVPTSTVVSDSEFVIQMNSVTATEGVVLDPSTMTSVAQEHQPSEELVAAAEEAQWERHASMISQAIEESNVAVVNAEALADAITTAKIEQQEELDSNDQIEREPEL
ncbi:MAG: SMC-Scp complex subunit ScpB [Bdellovibrionota bacterium]